MSFIDIDVKRNYISYGDNNIADALIRPALKQAVSYKRSVGFFSSTALDVLSDGVIELVRNGGTIKLITSPKLSAEDVEAIRYGYEKRDTIIHDIAINEIETAVNDFDDNRLQMLADLIQNKKLDIRVVLTKEIGMYHDKLGIFQDREGNKFVFFGSPNASATAYKYNYERVRTARSWAEGEATTVKEEEDEFDSIWDNTNKYIDTFNFQESISKKIIEINNERKATGKKSVIKLRKYQEAAIAAWKEKGYKGFYVMATGTGKTWTAIFSAKELLKEHSAAIVICAPYRHLVSQWAEDVSKIFPKAQLIMVYSDNPKWEEELTNAIVRQKMFPETQIVVISTISSFNGLKFKKIISQNKQEKLLIVDEAHRFVNRPQSILEDYNYLLGLSATPMSGKDAEQGSELVNFFGGMAYSLPIEEALEKEFLVKYNYYPLFVSATDDEERKFRQYSSKIAGCFSNGKLIDKDGLIQYTKARLRVISMAQEKETRIDEILSNVKARDHFIVYCGDGKLYNENRHEESRHIQFIKDTLDKHGYKPSQFTASENNARRMEMVEQFSNGEISALAAIRCLDEGINIPSITTALILSSNDNYREFVQRRGRILRKDGDKEFASIFDVLVLPSRETKQMAAIELRRYYEYARLASNKDGLMEKFEELLNSYDLLEEEVNTFITEVEEDEIDE